MRDEDQAEVGVVAGLGPFGGELVRAPGPQHTALGTPETGVDGREVTGQHLVHGAVHVLDPRPAEEHHVRGALDAGAVLVQGGQGLRQVSPGQAHPAQLARMGDQQAGIDLGHGLRVTQVVAPHPHVAAAFQGGRDEPRGVDDGDGPGPLGGFVQDQWVDRMHGEILPRRREIGADPAPLRRDTEVCSQDAG